MSYYPSPAQPNLYWLENELRRIAQAMEQGSTSMRLLPTSVMPDKAIEGEIRTADGVYWDPGRGAGTYIYRAGRWQLIEAGFHQNSRSMKFFLGE